MALPTNSAGSMRPGSSKAAASLALTGKSVMRSSSAGSLSSTPKGGWKLGLRASSSIHDDSAQWSTTWRPAPAHLVDEWRTLHPSGKQAVMLAREDQDKGEAQAYLGSCSLSNAGASLVAEVMRQGANLRTINLQHNQIADSGAIQLSEALETIPGLQVVCLSSNNIGDVGAARISKVLDHHTGLRLFSLDRNRICNAGAGKLCNGLTKNPRRGIDVGLAHNPVRRFSPKALESLVPVVDTVDRLAEVGVTLMTLLRIYTDGVADGSIRPRQTSTGEVVQKLLLPKCEVAIKSYVEAESPKNPPPMCLVVHAWDALFEDLVRAVASHACGQRNVEVLDPSHHQWCYSPEWTGKSYFIDAFCVNQHVHVNVRARREFSRFAEHPRLALGHPLCQVDKLDLVANKISQRGGRVLLVVDNENLILTRVHCLFELFMGLEDRLPMDVIFSGVRVFPRNKRGEMVQTAEATVDETRQLLLASIRDNPGFDAFNQTVLAFIDKMVDREFNAVLDQFESKNLY
eukprot:CAMPEP_0197893108 /NCGR_PEP_ID=MMETSP1439-20131203/32573_1 /TAXON_ID=66791 /ORGANISM="Gonyaulax spinifera, Strain CCMP409" /LENGTH=515 /DNA_ID=CAMNT_0043513359 /DNA_START=67 /DNA_END=1614 /DNA_ORIENTATION=-